MFFFFFFQAEDGIRDGTVTGVQTCALPIWPARTPGLPRRAARGAGSATHRWWRSPGTWGEGEPPRWPCRVTSSTRVRRWSGAWSTGWCPRPNSTPPCRISWTASPAALRTARASASRRCTPRSTWTSPRPTRTRSRSWPRPASCPTRERGCGPSWKSASRPGAAAGCKRSRPSSGRPSHTEYLVQLLEQGCFVERFFDEVDPRLQDALCAEDALGVAGHEQDADIGLESADPVGDLLSLHARHHYVGQEQVDMLCALGRGIKGLVAVGRGYHVVAVTRENTAGHLAHGWFVLHHEHELASASLGSAWCIPRGGRSLVRHGQQHGDRGADPDLGVDTHVPSGLGDDPVDGRQAQAGSLALGLGAEEGLEGPVYDLGTHPGAVVAHLQRDVPAHAQIGVAGRIRLIHVYVGGLDGELPAT